jgi:hypothetical protein
VGYCLIVSLTFQFRHKMQGVNLTRNEREILRRMGQRAYKEMVKTVGVERLAELSREHGKKGGRPSVYEPCTHYKPTKDKQGNINTRHRFLKRGVCKCGVRKVT